MGQSDLEAATNAWYQEVVDCSWPGCKESTNGKSVGHFTAMIWSATTEIGCATKTSNSIFICRYLDAPSNYGWNDDYVQNVAEPTKSFETCIVELQSGAPAPSSAPAPTPRPTPPTTPRPTPPPAPTTPAQDPCATCDFNPSFVCLLSGSCWGYSTKASCENAGGAFCVLPSCGSDEIIMNQQCIKKLDTDADRWVRAHNIFRCMHNAPYVIWSASAAENAQAYVDTLTGLAHSDSYKIPAPAGPAGENLAMGQSDLEAATNAWYQEVVDCSWPGCKESTNGKSVGHFTAMIWSATTEIGCATKTSNSIFICRYLNAPSNYGWNDDYVQNVAEPTKSFETCLVELQSGAPAPSSAPAPTPRPIPAPTPAPTVPTPEPTPQPTPPPTPVHKTDYEEKLYFGQKKRVTRKLCNRVYSGQFVHLVLSQE